MTIEEVKQLETNLSILTEITHIVIGGKNGDEEAEVVILDRSLVGSLISDLGYEITKGKRPITLNDLPF